MKKLLLLIALLAPMFSYAQVNVGTLPVIRNQLGTGTPAQNITIGLENARYVDDGYYHVPQYMPNFPTAATIWPRVVEVECDKNLKGDLFCEGYHWTPKLGRGEYLFVVPKMKEPAPIPQVTKIIEREIREVPVKPGKQ